MEKRKIKVLIVDDSDVILTSLKTFFEDYDFEVLTCIDGLQGIQKTSEFKPDIVFLDLMMPNFDGIKMLQVKKVLKDIKDIPVIVISANTAKSNVLAAIEAGADRVISKPIKEDAIIKNMNELLGADLFKASRRTLSENDSKDVQNHLKKFFLDSFPAKRQMLTEAIMKKNPSLLRMIVHEIKGAGGTIGYPMLTEISQDIMERNLDNQNDWMYVELKVGQLLQKVDQIRKDIKTKTI
ncbi:MAG: response regulator [bacterium]